MLQCKKYTEAPGRASFISRFVALFGHYPGKASNDAVVTSADLLRYLPQTAPIMASSR